MSAGLVIDLDGRRSFAAGESVEVAIAWDLPKAPKSLALELVWKTSGRGRTDARVAGRVVREGDLPAAGAEVIPWRMPAGPWTHEGKLLSITWAFRLSGFRKETAEVGVVLLSPEADGP